MITNVNDIHPGHYCETCGERAGEHRASDNRCPAGPVFPKWPTSIKDEARAAKVHDARVAKFWAVRTTVFFPVS